MFVQALSNRSLNDDSVTPEATPEKKLIRMEPLAEGFILVYATLKLCSKMNK